MSWEWGEWVVDSEDKPLIVSAGLQSLAIKAPYATKPRDEIVIEYKSTKLSAKVRLAYLIPMCYRFIEWTILTKFGMVLYVYLVMWFSMLG